MDWIMLVIVGIIIGVNLLRLLYGPFFIGKPTAIHTPGGYLLNATVAIATIFVAGRVISLW